MSQRSNSEGKKTHEHKGMECPLPFEPPSLHHEARPVPVLLVLNDAPDALPALPLFGFPFFKTPDSMYTVHRYQVLYRKFNELSNSIKTPNQAILTLNSIKTPNEAGLWLDNSMRNDLIWQYSQ